MPKYYESDYTGNRCPKEAAGESIYYAGEQGGPKIRACQGGNKISLRPENFQCYKRSHYGGGDEGKPTQNRFGQSNTGYQCDWRETNKIIQYRHANDDSPDVGVIHYCHFSFGYRKAPMVAAAIEDTMMVSALGTWIPTKERAGIPIASTPDIPPIIRCR